MRSKQIALRDPALAAIMGGLPDDFGAEHGGDDFGIDFGGDDWGYEFGADAPSVAMMPTKTEALSAWKAHTQQRAMTAQRARILEPNKGSAVKIERYGFAINAALVLGVASAINASNNPDTNIRPQRVTTNAPSPMFCTLSQLSVANVNVLVGGVFDAFDFNANGQDQQLDLPTLTPANRATIAGAYTGLVPPGFVGGTAVTFSLSLKGPASVIA
jgi:hypothetical protein